jgi:hypothetical protein
VASGCRHGPVNAHQRRGRTSNAASATSPSTAATSDQLLTITRHRLKRIQYRPDLMDGFLAHTGLSLKPDST